MFYIFNRIIMLLQIAHANMLLCRLASLMMRASDAVSKS